MIAYGQRSPFVTSVRIPHPPGGRESPDAFGLVFHVAAPLQDSVGVITPSSLHFVGTTRGSLMPEIDPAEHRLMIHGMVDRPLVFTMEDLMRLPSVTRLHFIECAGNRARRRHKTVQETHGMTSCAEWTGVLLSTLLKEAGVKDGASWVVAEGTENVKGASSFPLAKAMDDCIVAYGMNGEAVRPQNGFPLRLLIPGFEGIFNTKYLRRIKVVDRYYMNYNDYGHLRRDPVRAALGYQIGPKSVITRPSGGQRLPGPGFHEVSGLAWSGGGAISRVEVSTDAGRSWNEAEIQERRTAWRTPGSGSPGTGTDRRPRSCRAARTKWVRCSRRRPRSPSTSRGPRIRPTACRASTTRSSRGGSPATGAFTMGALDGPSRRPGRIRAVMHPALTALPMVMLLGASALAQGPTYGLGRTPTPEEVRAWDISIGPTGEELPPGSGTAAEGARIYRIRCAGCHGRNLEGGREPRRAPRLVKTEPGRDVDPWDAGRILPYRSPYATTVWDYINRGMPLYQEGTLTADEVYALTAFLLFRNDVIAEDLVLDAESLPQVEMPNRDDGRRSRNGSPESQGSQATPTRFLEQGPSSQLSQVWGSACPSAVLSS